MSFCQELVSLPGLTGTEGEVSFCKSYITWLTLYKCHHPPASPSSHSMCITGLLDSVKSIVVLNFQYMATVSGTSHWVFYSAALVRLYIITERRPDESVSPWKSAFAPFDPLVLPYPLLLPSHLPPFPPLIFPCPSFPQSSSFSSFSKDKKKWKNDFFTLQVNFLPIQSCTWPNLYEKCAHFISSSWSCNRGKQATSTNWESNMSKFLSSAWYGD